METKFQVGGNYFAESAGWETVLMDTHRFLFITIEKIKKADGRFYDSPLFVKGLQSIYYLNLAQTI